MTTRDIHNNILIKRAISPTRVTGNTAQVSQIIDTQDFRACEFVIATGTLADIDATFTALVEDGNDSGLSDAAPVADSELLGTETAAGFQFDDDDEVRKIGYLGGKRYVRLTITPANNAGNADIAALAILGKPSSSPTAQTQA